LASRTAWFDPGAYPCVIRPGLAISASVRAPVGVRTYTGEDSGRPVWSFFSAFVSSAQRLPNGSTLIDEGMDGRFFQITPDGDIVWEYIPPLERAMVVGFPRRVLILATVAVAPFF